MGTHVSVTLAAIGHPYEATLEALERWLPLLDKKGLLLVSLLILFGRQRGF